MLPQFFTFPSAAVNTSDKKYFRISLFYPPPAPGAKQERKVEEWTYVNLVFVERA